MKQRYWLFRRGVIYYLQDTETGKQESLRTSDKKEAEQIRDAKNEAVRRPGLGLALAKAYLSAHDPKLIERTWQDVFEEFTKRPPKESTRKRRKREFERPVYGALRNRKIVETTADEFRAVVAQAGVFGSACLKCLQNLAMGLGWLPWHIIPTKLWPEAQEKEKRAITQEEHQRIIAAETTNTERRLYYEFLWETGSAQSDAANMNAGNIDWETRRLTYRRMKTGEMCCLTIGSRLEEILTQLPSQGPLFPKTRMLEAKDRSAEFRRRCRLLKIEGVSLHSYRYAWAERACLSGVPERFAQAALGHSSRAVHHAYARRAIAVCPALEDYEKKKVPLDFRPPKRPPISAEPHTRRVPSGAS